MWLIENQLATLGEVPPLVVASLATFLWGYTDSKALDQFLYNVIVMASLSTVLFNANPLMRFDGYFILSDLIEIPNLYSEGSKSLKRLTNHLLWEKRTATRNLAIDNT